MGAEERENLRRYAHLALRIAATLPDNGRDLTESAGNGSVKAGVVDPSTFKNTG